MKPTRPPVSGGRSGSRGVASAASVSRTVVSGSPPDRYPPAAPNHHLAGALGERRHTAGPHEGVPRPHCCSADSSKKVLGRQPQACDRPYCVSPSASSRRVTGITRRSFASTQRFQVRRECGKIRHRRGRSSLDAPPERVSRGGPPDVAAPELSLGPRRPAADATMSLALPGHDSPQGIFRSDSTSPFRRPPTRSHRPDPHPARLRTRVGQAPPPPAGYGYGTAPASAGYGQPEAAGGVRQLAVSRWQGFIIDGLVNGIPASIGSSIISRAAPRPSMQTGRADDRPQRRVRIAGSILIAISIAIFVWNTRLRQGRTGQSGRQASGRRADLGDHPPADRRPWRSFATCATSSTRAVCYLGYLWPIWDRTGDVRGQDHGHLCPQGEHVGVEAAVVARVTGGAVLIDLHQHGIPVAVEPHLFTS